MLGPISHRNHSQTSPKFLGMGPAGGDAPPSPTSSHSSYIRQLLQILISHIVSITCFTSNLKKCKKYNITSQNSFVNFYVR
jgi:hypothetical protein